MIYPKKVKTHAIGLDKPLKTAKKVKTKQTTNTKTVKPAHGVEKPGKNVKRKPITETKKPEQNGKTIKAANKANGVETLEKTAKIKPIIETKKPEQNGKHNTANGVENSEKTTKATPTKIRNRAKKAKGGENLKKMTEATPIIEIKKPEQNRKRRKRANKANGIENSEKTSEATSIIETTKSEQNVKRRKRAKEANGVENSEETTEATPEAVKKVTKTKQPAPTVSEEAIKSSVDALMKVQKDKQEKSNQLFEDEEAIQLQIVPVKIPRKILHEQLTKYHHLDLELKHPIFDVSNSDFCLITPDLDKDENAEAYYGDKLAENGLQHIKNIIPKKKFLQEYTDYEAMKVFIQLYDVFYIDRSILPAIRVKLHRLKQGKCKQVVGVNMRANLLTKQFNTPLMRTELRMHLGGNCYNVQIAHTKMTNAQITDNLTSAINSLCAKFPGGLRNVQTLYLRTHKGVTIPIYLSTTTVHHVKSTTIRIKPKEHQKPVLGDVSTYAHKHTVVVYPSGSVKMLEHPKPMKKKAKFSARKSSKINRKTARQTKKGNQLKKANRK